MLIALAPAAFLLSLLAGIPVAVHLLTRRRAQSRVFPALSFLLGAHSGRAQRSHLRERVILALRSLVLICGALAVAGLSWRGPLVGDTSRPAVIVLDGSASMRQVSDSVTVFSHARAAASHLLADCSGRKVALLITGDGVGSGVGGEASLDYGAMASRLAEAQPGFGDGDPAGTIAHVTQILRQGGDCYFITDLARGSLSGVDPQALPSTISLHLINAGGGGDNLAVVGLSAEPGVAVAGRPVTVGARIANYSHTAQDISVNLRIGPHAEVLPIHLEAGALGSVTSTVTLDAAGSVPIEAELSSSRPDAFADDDRRSGRLDIVPGIATLLVSDADRDDEAGVVPPLMAALTASGLAPRLMDSSGLASEGTGSTSGRPALLITAGLRSVTAIAPAIKAHLDAGGAWLQVVASTADAQLQLVGSAVTPAVLTTRVDVSDQERGAMGIAQARLEHPLMAPFQGREALLRSVLAYRYFLTPKGAAADAQVLWSYADGTVALCERPVSTGRWLQLNCSPASIDSTLGRGEVLPLIIARLPAAMLPARTEHLAHDIGSSITVPGAITDPLNHALPATSGQVRLLQPGIYRLAGGALEAAAIPALESDLRQFDPALFKMSVSNLQEIATSATVMPLWPWLLLLAAAALATELLLAGGLGRPAGTSTVLTTPAEAH